MKLDSSMKEFFLHKTKSDFKQRLVAKTWEFNKNGRLTIARLNGVISSDRFFLKELGLEKEFKDLENYYNPNEWKEAYNPDTVSWELVRKEKAGVENA